MSDKTEALPNRILSLSVREFAVPCPRMGSIDAYSGYGTSSEEGVELQRYLQDKQRESEPDLESEVAIKQVFQREDLEVRVQGRMDGVFPGHGLPHRIEEIKATFNIWELSRTIQEKNLAHPYVLQLLTYGYFYYKESGKIPSLTLTLISSRNRETMELPFRLNIEEYEVWLALRLAELEEQADRIEKRVKRRKKIAASFPFPFEKPRPGQVELIRTIEEGMQAKARMLIQAPTGMGKTVAVLYPSLKDSLARGQRVVYVTPKNSQQAVAEDAVERFQNTGSNVRSLTLTAKSKICFKAEPLCNPAYCEFADAYYYKVEQSGVLAELAKKKKMTVNTFRKLGEKHQICPFQLQIDAVPEADVVIGDYNHVFASHSALGRVTEPEFFYRAEKLGDAEAAAGQPNLVVDEAHNLPSRAMDYYSPVLSSRALGAMLDDMKKLPKRFAKEGTELLDECRLLVQSYSPKDGKAAPVTLSVGPFLEIETKVRTYLSSYLESDIEIKPKDVVLRFTFYWSQFTEQLAAISTGAHPEFFTTVQPDIFGGSIKITCCDASKLIEERYDVFEQTVLFSATLKPFEFYTRLSGLDHDQTKIAEFQSPFEKCNRKILLIPQISTKFSERERNYGRIADAIRRVVELKPGNYLAFFPSFEFLRRVAAEFQIPDGFDLVLQERDMPARQIEVILSDLREGPPRGDRPRLLFAVQGGVFSEGVDYPGEMVIGAFVVGPPLPSFDIERETMRKYYQEHYGSGFDYAYAYPAMAKAVQAAGRVIRSESDRGVIILMDSRFTEASYVKSMPKDWFETTPSELISTSILKDLSSFWAKF